MTPTDELRAELTRRGVKWKPKRGRKRDGTVWHDRFGTHVEAVQEYTWDGTEQPDGKLLIEHGASYLTPAQAIAATVGSDKVEAVLRKLIAQLGVAADFHFARKYVDCIVEEYAGKLTMLSAGTCHNVHEPPKDTTFWPAPHFKCSECGATHVSMEYVYFCPNCSKKVVDG